MSALALMVRAEKIAASLAGVVSSHAIPSWCAVGGCGVPGVGLPSAAVSLAAALAGPLRLGAPPVVGHVKESRLRLDLLAVFPDDDEAITAAVRRALESPCT